MMVAPAVGGGGDAGPGAGSRWRFLALAAPGSSSPSLSAMLFKDSGGSAIAASGGTAIEASHFSTQVPANLFDGVDATYWTGRGDDGSSFVSGYGDWAGYQFAVAKAVRQLAIQKNSTIGSGYPAKGVIQYSSNGVAYRTVGYVIVPTLTDDVPNYFDFTNLIPTPGRTDYGAHRYWRMQVLAANQSPSGGRWAALSAMLFKDETGSSISLSGVSGVESGHFSTFAASALFDGNNSTFWESNDAGGSNSGFNLYAGVDFGGGNAKKVMQVALQRTASMDGSNPPLRCRFEYSDDAIVWVPTVSVEVGSLTNDVPTYFDLSKGL